MRKSRIRRPRWSVGCSCDSEILPVGAGETTAGETTAGETTAGETTAGETTAAETTVAETTALQGGRAKDALFAVAEGDTPSCDSLCLTAIEFGDGISRSALADTESPRQYPGY